MAENFRSVSFGEMLQPKMDCRHTAKSVVIFMPKTVRKLRGGRIEIHSNNIIINGKVTSIGYNQMSEQMSYVLQQLMGFFKITSC